MLEDYEKHMESCIRCSLCKWVPLAQVKNWRFSAICPSIEKYNFHAYSGGGRLAVAYAYLQGRVHPTKSLVNIAYQCSMCGGCDVSCKHVSNIEVYDTLLALRENLYKEGAVLPEHLKAVESTAKHGNPYGTLKEKKASWMKTLNLGVLKPGGRAELLYFAGCTTALYTPETARNTVKILEALDVDFAVLGADEPCCGSLAYELGAREAFEEQAKRNVELLNRLGVSVLVTSCAGCYKMFKVEYPSIVEVGFEVMHVSQLLEKLLKESRVKLHPLHLKVTYHDPCRLGRLGEPRKPGEVRRGGGGVYEAPRAVLRRIPGLELVEMSRVREYSYCCGAGGGVKQAFPDLASWAARERLEEAKATGAEVLVTCCPLCKVNLSEHLEDGSLKVCDLVDLIAKSMGVDE